MPDRKHRLLDFLFRSHRRELLVFAGQRTGGSLAEDLVQEAFLRMANHPNLDSIDNPRAFLFQTTSNLSIDLHRRQVLTDRYQCAEAEVEAEMGAVADHRQSPEQHLIRAQDLERLSAMLLELPDETRYAFVLNRIEGLSHAEVGQRLGISVRSSERHVSQALRQLLKQRNI